MPGRSLRQYGRCTSPAKLGLPNPSARAPTKSSSVRSPSPSGSSEETRQKGHRSSSAIVAPQGPAGPPAPPPKRGPGRTPTPGPCPSGGINLRSWRSSNPGQRGWIPGASGVTDHLYTSVTFSLTRKITRTNAPKRSYNGVLHCSRPGRPSYSSRV